MGGALLYELRLILGADTIGTVPASVIEAVTDIAAYDRALDDGYLRTLREGYKGPAIVESNDPMGVLRPPSVNASGAEAAEFDPKNTPLLPEVQKLADGISAASNEPPWSDVLKDQLDAQIGAEAQRAFDAVQVKAVEANANSISEGYESLNNGTLELDDPGANKLLGVQADIEAMLSQYDGKFPLSAQQLQAAIDDYVSSMLARNTQVMTYNAALTLAVRYTNQQDQMQQTAQKLTNDVLDRLSADTPVLTAFVSQAYYATRMRVLEYMDLASRAYRFWALTDVDLLRSSVGDVSPPAINATLLAEIQAAFWNTYVQAIGYVGSGQAFPNDPNERRGETYVVSGAAIDVFKTTRQLLVRAAATQKETSSGPFLNMANVRVTHARVYIKGAKTASQTLNLTVTHTGAEEIVSPRNQVFRFRHAAIPKTFKSYKRVAAKAPARRRNRSGAISLRRGDARRRQAQGADTRRRLVIHSQCLRLFRPHRSAGPSHRRSVTPGHLRQPVPIAARRKRVSAAS